MKKEIIKSILFILLSSFILFNINGTENNNKKVYIGIYLNDISNFDLNEGRFNADINIWCKWLGDDKTPKIEFNNAEIEKMDEIAKESDGNWHSVRWHIQGTFRGTFPLQKFPFDVQNLRIQIDLPKEEGGIVPDLAGSGMSSQFSITGWLYEPFFKADITENKFTSDFGSVINEGKPYETNSVIFSVTLQRPLIPYLVKFILPLLIIILISMGVFFISSEELEANMGIGVTSLLTCVAFQFSLADSIPDVPYLITSDKFFIITYIVIFINIVLTIVTYNVQKTNDSLSDKIDKYAWKGLGAVMVLSILLIFTTDLVFPKMKRAEITQKIEYEKQKTSKDELTFSVVSLKTLNTYNILHGLLYRGLVHKINNNERAPHLLVKVPDLTNEYVRLLQNGGVAVIWQLKPGLNWGDGKSITSKDLYFSINLIDDSNRKDVKIIDKYTIEAEYYKRKKNIIDDFMLYPRHRFEKIKNKLKNEENINLKTLDEISNILRTDPPPMDGPYILKEFKPEKYAKFVINNYFEGKKPNIKTIYVKQLEKSVPDTLNANETDICSNLSTETFNEVLGIEGYEISEDQYTSMYLLQPDLDIFPYNNYEFREALINALDRKNITKMLFGKKGIIANSYRPDFAPDFNNDVIDYKYRPIKSKMTFKSLGIYEPIKLIVYQPIVNSPTWQVVEAIRDDLINAGLSVNIEYVDSTIKIFKEGNHGGLLFTSQNSDLYNYKRFWNIQYDKEISKPERLFTDDVIELSEKMEKTMFTERQYAISQQLQNLWNERLPIIPLSFGVYRSIYNNKLKGWDPKAVDDNIWWNVEYWYFEEITK